MLNYDTRTIDIQFYKLALGSRNCLVQSELWVSALKTPWTLQCFEPFVVLRRTSIDARFDRLQWIGRGWVFVVLRRADISLWRKRTVLGWRLFCDLVLKFFLVGSDFVPEVFNI